MGAQLYFVVLWIKLQNMNGANRCRILWERTVKMLTAWNGFVLAVYGIDLLVQDFLFTIWILYSLSSTSILSYIAYMIHRIVECHGLTSCVLRSNEVIIIFLIGVKTEQCIFPYISRLVILGFQKWSVRPLSLVVSGERFHGWPQNF